MSFVRVAPLFGMTDHIAIAIRPAKSQERDILSELAFRSKASWGYSSEFMEACRAELSISEEEIASPDRHYVLAEANCEILGYYALERLSADEYELEALFVEPQHFGQGVGRRLIEHAKFHAREKGAWSLLIQGDPNATDFYRAAGGVQIGERKSDSIPGRYLPEFRISLEAENAA
jgi:N-acetylglutamate synthase-like GNAT family acetyltransferase